MAIARGAGLLALAAALGLTRLAMAATRIVGARPVLFAGCSLFIAAGAIVSANALLWQGMHHPQPMLTTRVVEAQAATGEVAAGPQPWRPSNDPRIMSVPLVREVQALLAQTGYYEAEIDGRPGQATDRAIRTFQAERGLRVDGMATPLLLTQIRQAGGTAPQPREASEGRQYAGLNDLMSDLQTDSIDIPILDEEPADPQLVRQIQEKLASAKVAELTADGIMGSKTRSAIRSFQELDGMTVTGEPTPELLARLEALAASQ